MTSRDSTKPASIVAFPSVSSSLHSLPQATSIQNVNLHPNMFAQRAAESEAKVRTFAPMHSLRLALTVSSQLQKALSKTPSSFTPQSQPMVYRSPVCLQLLKHYPALLFTPSFLAIITFSRSFIWSDDADSTYICHCSGHCFLTASLIEIKILDLNMSPCSSPFPSLDSTFYGPCPPALPPLDSAA